MRWLIFLFPVWIFAKEIAITIDDFPMYDGVLFSAEKQLEAFLAAADRHKCQMAFFCIGKNCLRPKGEVYLALANEKGHFLANHSMYHEPLHRYSLERFKREVLEVEPILNRFDHFRRWFRYPYLDYGNGFGGGSDEKAYLSLQFLEESGYTDGYVTIDTFDWYFRQKLEKVVQEGKSIDYEKLKEVYLDHIIACCNHFSALHNYYFPREIVHVLLLHASDLNALYLNEILGRLARSGWTIVSPEKAFADVTWRTGYLRNKSAIDYRTERFLQEVDQLFSRF